MTGLGVRWRLDAACIDVPGDCWFPEEPWVVDPLALRVCLSCPVRRACLLYALSHADIQYGVWGGLTAHEVAGLRRRILSGQPPAAVVADGEAKAEHRVGKTIFRTNYSAVSISEDTLARQSTSVEAALVDASLITDESLRARRAA